MSDGSSRIAGFYRLSVAERRRVVADALAGRDTLRAVLDDLEAPLSVRVSAAAVLARLGPDPGPAVTAATPADEVDPGERIARDVRALFAAAQVELDGGGGGS